MSSLKVSESALSSFLEYFFTILHVSTFTMSKYYLKLLEVLNSGGVCCPSLALVHLLGPVPPPSAVSQGQVTLPTHPEPRSREGSGEGEDDILFIALFFQQPSQGIWCIITVGKGIWPYQETHHVDQVTIVKKKKKIC